MNTLADIAVAAVHEHGFIVVRMASGAENPRLAGGTPAQLRHIEISPFGRNWPELDEDLSFRGLLEGHHGQKAKV